MQNDAGPPLPVLNRRADGHGRFVFGCFGPLLAAAVTVAARFGTVSAEIRQQELAAAVRGLGVGPHHLHSGVVHPLANL